MDHPEKAKRKPTRYSKKWALIVGCVVFLWVGLFGFLKSRMPYLTCFGTLFPSHADVERQTAFELPASADHVDYDVNKYDYEAGCLFWVKFDIAPEDLEVIKALPPINMDSPWIRPFESKPTPIQIDAYLLREWGRTQPVDSIIGYSSEVNIPHFGQQIFIDTTSPSNFVVYISTWRQYP